MDKASLLNVLSQHIGRDAGISVDLLANLTGMHPRLIRTCVSQLRGDGIAICGHPTSGYYIAKTAEEIEETCQFLRTRAMHSLLLEAKLRRLPLPDLLGQLRLKT